MPYDTGKRLHRARNLLDTLLGENCRRQVSVGVVRIMNLQKGYPKTIAKTAATRRVTITYTSASQILTPETSQTFSEKADLRFIHTILFRLTLHNHTTFTTNKQTINQTNIRLCRKSATRRRNHFSICLLEDVQDLWRVPSAVSSRFFLAEP
jgi:hypothetical protein